MIIDYSAFVDELEKIAKSKLRGMYEVGEAGLDDVLSAVKRRKNVEIDPKVRAQVEEARQQLKQFYARASKAKQRMAKQEEELVELARRAKEPMPPKPAPVVPTTRPKPSPSPSSGPSSISPRTQGQKGMSPMAIAGLGLGAAGVVGAGAYGIHRLRQRQAQQAQQGM